ncbi:uncharacterized protein RHO17_021167 [Thomomys bottae]
MANVLSKLCQELCGLTFPRWVASTGPGPARCLVCRKGGPDLGQAPPSAGQRRAPKRRCPLPEATDPTPGEDPSASPEQAPKKPAPALPPGDSALEIPRSPGTLSCQLGVPPRIPKCKPLAQLGEPRTPCDVPLPDPRDAEVKGPEDPKGTPSNGHDISSSQSSTMDRLGANQLQTCSHFQESGKVVEGKKPTALPPPDSQESAKGVVSEAPTASPPTSPAVPSLTARRAPKRKDSQESAKELGVKKPKAHPPPDFQESTKVEGGEMSKDNAPTIPATTNVAPRRAPKRKATLPSVLPLPLPQSVPMPWGRTELPPPPKLPCMDVEKDLDICEVTQFTHIKIYKREGTGRRREVTDGSDTNTASSASSLEAGTCVCMPLPTCTANTPALPNNPSVEEEQAAETNTMAGSSSNPKEALTSKTSNSLAPPVDSLPACTPASNLGMLNDINGDHAPFMRAVTLPNSLSKSTPPDHCPLPSTKESCTLMCVDSPPLSFPTLPVLLVPIGVNTTTTDLAALTPSISSHVTMQPATDDDVVQMDTTPPSEAIIFSSPPGSSFDTCVFPQVPSSLQQGNFLNGSAPSNLPRPPPCPLPQVPRSLQQGPLLPGPMPTGPSISHPFPFPQAVCSLHQGHITINSVPTKALVPDPHPSPQVPCSLHQGQILNGQAPSSAATSHACSFSQVICSMYQGQLMGPGPTAPPTTYTYSVPQVPCSLHKGQPGTGPTSTNPPPPMVSCPSQSLVPHNNHWTTNVTNTLQQQHTVPHGGIISSIPNANNHFLQSKPKKGSSTNTGHPSSTRAFPYPTLGVFNRQSDNLSLSHQAALPAPAVCLTVPTAQQTDDTLMQSGYTAMTMPLSTVNTPRMLNPSQALLPQNDPGSTNAILAVHQQHSASVPTGGAPSILSNMGQANAPVPGSYASPSTKPSIDNDSMMDITPPSEASVFPSPLILTNNHSALNQAPPPSDHVPHSGTISNVQDPSNQFLQSQPMQGPSPNTSHRSTRGALLHSTTGAPKEKSDSFSLSYPAALPTTVVDLTAPAMQPPNDTIMQSGQMATAAPLSTVNPHRVPYNSQTLLPQNDPWITNVFPVAQLQHSASPPTHAALSLLPNMGQTIASLLGSNASPSSKPSVDNDNRMDKKPPPEVSYFPYPPVLRSSHSVLNQAPSASYYMGNRSTISNMQDPSNQFLQSQPMQGPRPNTSHRSTRGARLHSTTGAPKRKSDSFSLSYPAALPTIAVDLTAPAMQPPNDTIMQSGQMAMAAPLSTVNPYRVPYNSQTLLPQNDPWITNVFPVAQPQHSASPPTHAALSLLPNMGQTIASLPGSNASPPSKPSVDNDRRMDKKPPSEVSYFPYPPVLRSRHSVLNQAPIASYYMGNRSTISNMQDPSNQFLQSQPMQGPRPNTSHRSTRGARLHSTTGAPKRKSDSFSLSYPAALPTIAVDLTVPPMQPPNDTPMQLGQVVMSAPLSTVNLPSVSDASQALVPQKNSWTTNVIPVAQQQHSASVHTYGVPSVLPNLSLATGPISGSTASLLTKPSTDNDNMMDTMPPSEASIILSLPVLANNHSSINQASPASDHMLHNGTISSMQDSNFQLIQSQSMQGPSPNTGHQFSTGALPHPTLGVFNGQSDNFSLSHPVSLPTPAVGLTAPATQLSNDIIMQSGHMAMTMPLSTVTPASTLQQAFCSNSQPVFYTAVPTKTGIKISSQTGSGDTKTSLNQTSPATSATMGNGDPPNAGHMGFGTFNKHLRSKSKAYKGCGGRNLKCRKSNSLTGLRKIPTF